jgi:signal transduction histidine kinase
MPAMARTPKLPPPWRGLSARLLILTVVFVLIGEVLIYVPSIARFRLTFLEERIAAAHLATLALAAAPEGRVEIALADQLTLQAGVLGVTLRRPEAELMLGELPPVDAVFDLREATIAGLVLDSFATLWHRGRRTIRVIGPSPHEMATVVDISLAEGALWIEMVDYSWRILYLSIVLSLMVAVAVYACLQLIIVGPLRRITQSVIAFRDRPEDIGPDLPPGRRRDEIGVVEGELRDMQEGLRASLLQKTRLAALGAAVGRINHDLRNLLSTAILLSERLERSQDPEVRRIAPRLVEAIERAARLCGETLGFARAHSPRPRRTRFALAPLVDEVGQAVLAGDGDGLSWESAVPDDLTLHADRDQLFRALLNLGRNSREALGEGPGRIVVRAASAEGRVRIEILDSGPGIPLRVRPHLFEAFAASGRPGGTGLGLTIAREILRAHGGDLSLARSDATGTLFVLDLPAERAKRRSAA